MKKDFTEEDIIKKHETNVKAAFTTYFLTGVLGIIYIFRYLIKQEFDFHFSLSFTDMILKFEHSEEISTAVCIGAIVAFLIIYIIPLILLFKNPKYLSMALGVYFFDFLVLLFCVFVLWLKPTTNDWLIDVILHIFGLVFLFVGVMSEKKLRKMK